ncbi:sugar phosphate nucleotidyltransferase [Streptacidiphilus cavernicola]|uniref:Sugar phosphate nucleotidyltransferase n=1 Tax=Streptacidiphilus cavernicola TaxID=3342716 RepID=A0ABV6VQU5_9ACTN
MAGGGRETVGIILAGGRGERAKPITLESADYIRSKALIPFAGRRLIEWVVDACREQGIRRFYVVAQGLENRNQIKLLLGHGERYGVDIQYSRARFDRYNVGSGAATLHNLEYWDLRDQALVLPVDSIFEFSLAEMEATHRRNGALVTVAAVERTAAEVAGKYGAMQTGSNGLVNGFVEKPGLERISRLFPGAADPDLGALIPTNAGMYLVDSNGLRRAARDPELMRLAQQRLDWGGDLLPWLVGHGLMVAVHPIDRLGDLGSVEDYLLTLGEVLGGGYPQMDQLMEVPHNKEPRYWIDETSLNTRDERTGTTLAQKIEDGSVVIGPGVRIGRHVEIGSGVRMEYADIGDGVELREGARLSRTACGDSSVIGPYAEISDCYVGPMAEVESERRRPVRLESFTALGDGVHLWPGTELSRVSVYPRLRIPTVTGLPPGTSITSAEDLGRWL